MYYLSSQLVVTNKLGTLNDVTELDTKYATGNIQLHKLLTILLLMSCRNESARQKQTKNQWIVGVNKVFLLPSL